MDVHRRFIVRAEKAHAFFGDLCELEEGDHLEAALVVSFSCSIFLGLSSGVWEELTLRYLLTCQSSWNSIPVVWHQ
jgi:hypothetical protein